MDKSDFSDRITLLSPLVTCASMTDKDREASRKWIAAYLSGMDEDDFRKRYFKTQKCQTSSVCFRMTQGDSNSSPTSNSTRSSCSRLSRQTSNISADRFSDVNVPRDSNACDLDYPNAAGYSIVSNTDDILAKWQNRTPDDCRLWYIKTLMARKVFSETPSIKQQKSSFRPH